MALYVLDIGTLFCLIRKAVRKLFELGKRWKKNFHRLLPCFIKNSKLPACHKFHDHAAEVDGIMPGIRSQSARSVSVYTVSPLTQLELRILTFLQLLWDTLGINGFLGDHSFWNALSGITGITVYGRHKAPKHSIFRARFFSIIILPIYTLFYRAYKKWLSKSV